MDPDGGVLKFGRFEIDLARRELRRNGTPVDLQRIPLRLLLHLAEHRDRTVSQEDLFGALWPASAVTDSSLTSAVNQLRRAVGDDGASQQVVRTLRGRGYRFVADAQVAKPSPMRSLAVLPLENLSGDPEQEYFADGMTESLIAELAKIGSVRVISRRSVMRYKGTQKTVPEIAAELDVEALIEGSVIREDTRIRINLQLVDGRSDTHLWIKSYERDLQSVLALQGEVARGVATQMRVELTPDERSRLTSTRTVKPEAYDAYMRATHLMMATGLDDIQAWGLKAVEHLESAVELDDDFARAWALLSTAYTLPRLRSPAGGNTWGEKARASTQRALELDDCLGYAQASLGHVLRFYDWDFDAARRAYERGAELSPNDAGVLLDHAVFLAEVDGRAEEALALSARLPLLAPFTPWAHIWHADILFENRQYEGALQEFERVREMVPGFSNYTELLCCVRLARPEEVYRCLMAGPGTVLDREAREKVWSEGGWPAVNRAWIDAAAEKPYVNPAIIAMHCAEIGQFDEAFAWLERAYQARDPMITNLKNGHFSELRSDPRYDELVRRIGLPES